MKKKITYFLLLNTLLMAQEYGVEDFIGLYKDNSFQNQYEEIEIKKLDNNLTELEKGSKDGVDVSLNTNYLSEPDTLSSTIKLDYDFLNFKSSYDFSDRDWSSSIGVEKDIKDYIYSENSYKLELLDYERKVTKNNLEKKKETEVLEIISLYKNYQDNLIDLNLYMENKESLYKDYKRVEKEYELGVGTRLDYRYAEVTYNNLLKDIEILEDKIKEIRREFQSKYSIYITEEDTLLPLSNSLLTETLDLSNIGQRDLETLEYEKASADESLKYSIYENKTPNMSVGADYYLDSSEWALNFTISKTFGDYDSETIGNQLDVDKYEIQKEEILEDIKTAKEGLLNKYNSLTKELEQDKGNREVAELKYLINQKKYDQGSLAFIDYMESYDDYREAKSRYLKKENELKSLMLEVLNRR